ncbi:aldehyde dehydrogenase family protein [Faecalibacter rhinopitheci]|uniref:Aldehyde dehydrogenase n=1 Tax=Faecalibacter rhinopitheci TaxID=2779678 RepID=A0A8J7K389_9FLAO|nr:aldehyde dehydrogenase family protein [Faecalibacter rhinopitheci]MBF0595864.1 aldehyde dehydrogenase family protein [Faecalibacter rhinopitheci]
MLRNEFQIIDQIYDSQVENKFIIKKLTVNERIILLQKLEESILAHRQEITQGLHLDFRKSIIEAESTEIFPIISEIRLFRKNLKKWAKTKSVSNNIVFFGSNAKIQYEAKGNCLIISPWNYPFQLALVHLVACIAAGNTAIVKPSEFSPNTNKVVKKIINSVFSSNHVEVVKGEIDVTTHLLNKKFDHIHFTGSPKVGKIIMAAGAKHLSSVTLELGGKSPLIIDDTMPLETIVSKAIWGKLVNNGQTCIAPDYILIQENRLNDFVKSAIKYLEKTFGQDPKESPDLARIINNKNFHRIRDLIQDSIAKGAKCPYGNDYDEKELYIKPTLLTHVDSNSEILHEEIFGPVFPIISYTTINEAINFINEREKPLALYIFSKNKALIQQISDETSSGAVMVNETLIHIMHPNLPFGGVNNSGIGSSTGKFGFEDFSHAKPVLDVNQLVSPTKFINYPYNSRTQKIINLMMKYL